ncbi:unnamed protein product [Closterium sp. NIES-65]|nr:unnamed protein product [Closterium sp. NIES-65]
MLLGCCAVESTRILLEWGVESPGGGTAGWDCRNATWLSCTTDGFVTSIWSLPDAFGALSTLSSSPSSSIHPRAITDTPISRSIIDTPITGSLPDAFSALSSLTALTYFPPLALLPSYPSLPSPLSSLPPIPPSRPSLPSCHPTFSYSPLALLPSHPSLPYLPPIPPSHPSFPSPAPSATPPWWVLSLVHCSLSHFPLWPAPLLFSPRPSHLSLPSSTSLPLALPISPSPPLPPFLFPLPSLPALPSTIRNTTLAGPLPSALQSLSALQYLSVHFSSLSLARLKSRSIFPPLALFSPLSSALHYLSALQYLRSQHCNTCQSTSPSHLWRDAKQSTPPSCMCSAPSTALHFLSALQYLSIPYNKFSGTIPEYLGSLSALSFLDVFSNAFEGPIPDTLTLLTNLVLLKIGNWHLNGSIPGDIGNLKALTFLSGEGWGGMKRGGVGWMGKIGNWHLNGSIPGDIGNLKALTFLELQGVDLYGPFPESTAHHPTTRPALSPFSPQSLLFTYLLTSPPRSHPSLLFPPIDPRELEGADMDGPFPEELQGADMDGPFPESVTQLTNLELFHLGLTGLHGSLPEGIGDLTKLSNLNRLSGRIPSTLGRLTALVRLELDDNSFNSTIPAALGNLALVTKLDFSKNPLNGSLPPAFGALSSLANMSLYGTWLECPTNQPCGVEQTPHSAFCQLCSGFCKECSSYVGTLPDGSATCVPKTISPSPPSSPSPPPTSPSPPSSPSPSPPTSPSPSPPTKAPPSASPPSPPSSSPSSSSDSSSLSLGVIVGVAIGAGALVIACLALICILVKGRPTTGPSSAVPGLIRRYSLSEVLQATDSWSRNYFGAAAWQSLSEVLQATDSWASYNHLVQVNPSLHLPLSHPSFSVPGLFRRYSLPEVLQATNNWASYNHLGSGGYGDVYKGVPPSARVGGGGGGVGGMGGVGGDSGEAGMTGASVNVRGSGRGSGRGSVWGSKRGGGGEGEVGITVDAGEPQVWAVKRAKIRTNDFHKEVELMASKHHPHLVWLLGYCVTTDAKTHEQEQATCRADGKQASPPSRPLAGVELMASKHHPHLVRLLGYCVELMASKHHPHLVRLLGYCVTTDAKTHEQEQIIIYEFMENGDLERVLKKVVCEYIGAHEQEEIINYLASRPVSLQQRLEMMIGAARGLEYLHSFSMVHRDVKPANILLDGNWQVCAKVADFGLTKMGEGNAYNPQDSTRVLGTPGYVDPVYGRTRKATPANDVFSFGIVMLELLTGRRAIVSVSKDDDPINISKWAAPLVERGEVAAFKDPHLDAPDDVILRLARLAMTCTATPAMSRPRMVKIVADLEGIKEELFKYGTMMFEEEPAVPNQSLTQAISQVECTEVPTRSLSPFSLASCDSNARASLRREPAANLTITVNPVQTTVKMCGILAVLGAADASARTRAKVLECTARLRHRGPDWSGVHTFGNNFLAHERLAVIDPASGHQPLRNEDGSIVVAVNGEIYNYQQLRDELKDRHTFNTGSDCEVIAHLYEDAGEQAVQKLDGIFAFVLLNTKDGSYIAARDPIGVCPLYIGWGRDGSMWFASEMKALKDDCERFETFPPGHIYSSNDHTLRRWYNPAWYDEHIPSAPYDPLALRAAFEKAVVKRLMTDVPFGVLLSGGLDSSLVAAVAQRHLASTEAGKQWGPQLHSYCIGLENAPDLRAAKEVADYIGTNHHELHFTVQEGIDAISEVIYHTETYDVTTIRASTPMFLLSRKIKALGVKMVLSGEGSDEVFGGYLYFHKAPSKEEFHVETCHKLKALHMYDCLRANKATSAWGLEARVPFLDKEFLDVAMSIDPQYKMIRKEDGRIEKWVIRRAFDDEEKPYLPKHILYRQKEQFSDGVGYSWIDGLKAHAERMVSDQMMANAPNLFTHNTPKTKEALFYRLIFEKHFPQLSARLTVPGGPSVACSTAAAVAWDAAWLGNLDPSGRAALGVHAAAYNEDAGGNQKAGNRVTTCVEQAGVVVGGGSGGKRSQGEEGGQPESPPKKKKTDLVMPYLAVA